MKISKNTIRALTGSYEGQLQDIFLKQGETKLIPYQITLNGTPVDITGYSFTSELRELISDFAQDSNNGYSISNPRHEASANVISLTSNISVTNANTGNVSLFIPSTVTSVEAELASTNPVMYYGYFGINNGQTNAEIQKINILVVVNNDGV